MKKNIGKALVLPCLLCTLFVAKKCPDKPEFNKYGNLLKWSGKTIHNEGYELRYEYDNPSTHTREEKLASAFGNEPTTGLLPDASDAKAMKASVKTEDGVLSLTRSFILDEKKQALEVWLVVRNISLHPVDLKSINLKMICCPKDKDAKLVLPFCIPCEDDIGGGTDCHPAICPPDHGFFDEVSRPDYFAPRVNVNGKLPFYSWSVGQNMPLKGLQPGQAKAFGQRIRR